MGTDVALFIFVLGISSASPNASADRAVMQAYYKQSGLDVTLRRFEREEIPQDVRLYLGHAVFISKTIVDKKINIQWSFP